MNAAEIKLDLFRKIDNLKDADLERIYQTFLSLLSSSEKYSLTDEERKAIEEALEYSRRGETFTHESIVNEAQKRYTSLKFK